MSTQVSKVEELDSIRGIAALLVVLYHMPAWNPWLHAVPGIHNSFYMVDLFFVLSGYVMTLNYGDRLKTGRDLARFQVLRLGRLYPVHVLFLLVALLTAASGYIAASLFGLHIPNGTAFKGTTFTTFVEQLLMVHALGFFRIEHPLNLPSWSISVEFYTYLVFALLCLVSWKRARLWMFAALCAGSAFCLYLGEDFVGDFSQILQCFAGYFMGCLAAVLAARRPTLLPRGSTIAALLAMVVFLSLESGPHFDVTIFVLSAMLVLAVVSSPQDAGKALLRQRWLKFLGLISYSIYMSHTFVLWCCNQFVRVVLRAPETVGADGISTPQLPLWGALVMSTVAVAGTIVLSYVVFRYVEDRWRVKSKDFVRARMSAPAPVAKPGVLSGE
jgi:peptidoglycan/LPS O-acetylase OafA/YrhL